MQTLDGQQRARVVEAAARQLDHDDQEARRILTDLWNAAFEEGRLAALDEFQDRFCVCMK